MQVQQLQRDDFLQNYWNPYPGEHANWIAPTGGGKSYFMYQCCRRFMQKYPELTYCSFMPKARDETTDFWASKLRMKKTDKWPPVKKWWEEKPNGHVLWPPHIPDDEKANREQMANIFRGAINKQYWDGNSVTIVDDAYLVGALMGLNDELDRHWMAGRSSHASLFTTLQKPSGTVRGGISSFAYDSPTHLFLGRDNDERNLQRFSEIAVSQIDPDQIKSIVRHLPVTQFGNSAVSHMLYLDRRGPYLAVITP